MSTRGANQPCVYTLLERSLANDEDEQYLKLTFRLLKHKPGVSTTLVREVSRAPEMASGPYGFLVIATVARFMNFQAQDHQCYEVL